VTRVTGDPIALPPEITTLRDRLRAFLEGEVLPAEKSEGVVDESQASPALRRWVLTRSAELGFYRLAQPAELGGGGLGPLGLTALHEEIARSQCALGGLILGGDGGLLRMATAAQRERFLAPVLRGELTAALAFTDAREGPRTTAVRRGDVFVVSGVKSFVTGGPQADLLLTVAKVTDNPGGRTGTAVFVVRRDAPGVTLASEIRTLDGGLHGEFELKNVEVPAGDLIGEIGQGVPKALESITSLRLRASAAACGTARWTLDYALEQARRPHRTGVPLGEREQVQAMLGQSAMDLFAARGALYAAAQAAEAGDAETEVAMAKAVATEAVARIVDRAIQLTGGAAVVEGHPLARLYRRIRAWRIAEGTTEILRLTVARRLLAAGPASPHPTPEGDQRDASQQTP
jgi:alkylation response protein AidB-like acyl-CoA dehydrogenase